MTAWIVVAVLSVGVAALLAAADGALLATGPAAPRPVIRHPERAHRALAIARVIAHLLTGMAVALAILRPRMGIIAAILVAVVFLLANVVIVEGAARSAGYAGGMTTIRRLAPIVAIVDVVLLPASWIAGLIERGLAAVMPPADHADLQKEESTEQFREVVTAEAEVTPAEEELLHGVFSLGDTEVREIMVPRVDVVGIDRATPWSEVLDRVRSSEHARFPVFDETLDNALGILYAKDLLPTIVADTEPEDWPSLIRPAQFIPATKTIDQQLRDFKAQRTHIAIVIDEYGGTAGLVTIEDVLEEIVGEIRDEYDEEEPAIEQEGHQRFWVSGRVTLADLSELLGRDFQRDDLTTVGGLVYDAFGRVPRGGDSRILDGFKVVVERVRGRRVERVYFERIATADDEGSTE